jgi:hypothetical protein
MGSTGGGEGEFFSSEMGEFSSMVWGITDCGSADSTRFMSELPLQINWQLRLY